MQLVNTGRAGLHLAGNKRDGEEGEETNIVVMKPDISAAMALGIWGIRGVLRLVCLRIPRVSWAMRRDIGARNEPTWRAMYTRITRRQQIRRQRVSIEECCVVSSRVFECVEDGNQVFGPRNNNRNRSPQRASESGATALARVMTLLQLWPVQHRGYRYTAQGAVIEEEDDLRSI
jgi:hypothetical protein